MENANNKETLLARWLTNEVTPEELEALQKQEDFTDLQAIVEGLKGLEPPAFSENEAWERLQMLRKKEPLKNQPVEITTATVEQPPKNAVEPVTPQVLTPVEDTPVRSIFRRRGLFAIAAAVAVLLVSIWFFGNTGERYGTTIATAVGKQQQVNLPDGSEVILNALSKISFTEEDWPEKRFAALEGEAYFRAKKGNTFTIKTGQGTVKVVGTAFNVYARGTELAVKCTQGKVQVTNPKGTERVLIKAGEQVSVQNGDLQRRRGIDFTPKWFDGISKFKSAALPTVFAEMERQFDILVIDESKNTGTFSGTFLHEDLKKALKMVCDPMDLQYEISGDTVKVY